MYTPPAVASVAACWQPAHAHASASSQHSHGLLLPLYSISVPLSLRLLQRDQLPWSCQRAPSTTEYLKILPNQCRATNLLNTRVDFFQLRKLRRTATAPHRLRRAWRIVRAQAAKRRIGGVQEQRIARREYTQAKIIGVLQASQTAFNDRRARCLYHHALYPKFLVDAAASARMSRRG